MRIRPAGNAEEDTIYANSHCPRKAHASRDRLVTHDLNVRERTFSSHWRCRVMTVILSGNNFSLHNGFTDVLSLHQCCVYINIKRAQQAPVSSVFSIFPSRSTAKGGGKGSFWMCLKKRFQKAFRCHTTTYFLQKTVVLTYTDSQSTCKQWHSHQRLEEGSHQRENRVGNYFMQWHWVWENYGHGFSNNWSLAARCEGVGSTAPHKLHRRCCKELQTHCWR